MIHINHVYLTAALILCAGSSCALAGSKTMTVTGESLVLAATEPGNLCFDQVVPASVVVRSVYDPKEAKVVVYAEGKDYTIDYKNGTIRRTADSTIPDYTKSNLYGKKQFNHNDFPGFTNNGFFVFVDYKTENGRPYAKIVNQAAFLTKTKAKLKAGGPFKIVSYGDSITSGGEASREDLRFQNRFIAHLQSLYLKAQISHDNTAQGGAGTDWGLSALPDTVISHKPDLVMIGFGMNDQAGGGGNSNTPLDKFISNLKGMIKDIREKTGAEVILFSSFLSNPDWIFSSGKAPIFAKATEDAAKSEGCAYADVYSVWTNVLTRKDLHSLLGNNINHPNDFGHFLYLQAFEAIEF